MTVLSLIYGAMVGFSLGLTGGGGAIFAVPLLIYGIGLPAREAVGVSLLTVSVTAVVGLIQRTRRGLVEFPTGLLFAVAGMLGAPGGAWLSRQMPEWLLLALFAGLMLTVAARMWIKAADSEARLPVLDDNAGPTCRRDPAGKLRLTSQCALLLGVIGLVTGVLTGLFGVGGGFIIVPALVMFSGMGMQRAIGTSLLVISLVSAMGVANHLVAGNSLSQAPAVLFTAGGVGGLLAGGRLSQRVSGPILQRVFAAAILLVALFVFVGTFWI